MARFGVAVSVLLVAGCSSAPSATTATLTGQASSTTIQPADPETDVVVTAAPVTPALPSPATGPPTTPPAPVGPQPIAVDAAAPPPLVAPTPLVTIPLAPNPNRNRVSVAIGESSIAVRQPDTDVVTLIDYVADGDAVVAVRDLRLDEPLYAIVQGPGDVLYGFGDAPIVDGIPDARYVAIPVSGPDAGSVVAEVSLSWLMYTELPAGVFGHGPDGVIDRLRAVNSTVISYVDASGDPLDWPGPAPPLLTWETDLEGGGRISVLSGDVAWDLVIIKSPDHGGDYVGPSPPAPTSRGRVIYSDNIGADLTPDQDFGPNQMPVVAILEPDGSGRWIRLPDDWSVAASDLWGTVLMRITDDSIELALLDDVLDASTIGTTPIHSARNPDVALVVAPVTSG